MIESTEKSPLNLMSEYPFEMEDDVGELIGF